MDLIAKAIETLNNPAVPLWVKILLLAAAVAAVIIRLIKPPHWADAETPTERGSERLARPPD